MAEVVINGVHFNVDACKTMSEKKFINVMDDVHFLDKPKEERQAILKDAYKMIVGNTETDKVETSDTVDAD